MGWHRSEATLTSPGKIVKKNDDALDALRYACRSFPTWTAAYRCGPTKYVIDAPMRNAPLRLPEDRHVPTVDEQRAALSNRFKTRTRQSVLKEFGRRWYHRVPV